MTYPRTFEVLEPGPSRHWNASIYGERRFWRCASSDAWGESLGLKWGKRLADLEELVNRGEAREIFNDEGATT
jgi:hypothetical protein